MYPNLSYTDRLVHLGVGLCLLFAGYYFNPWLFLLAVPLIIFGSSGYSFFFHLIGWNEKIRRQSLHHEHIVEDYPGPILIFESSGKTVYRNDKAEAVFPDALSMDNLFNENTLCAGFDQESEGYKHARVHVAEQIYLVSGEPKDDGITVAYATDITALAQEEAILRKMTITDTLTGLFNRRKLLDDLYASPEAFHALFLLDIQEFGQINAFYGYSKGDEYLRQFTRFLRDASENLYYQSSLYRLQGDVFAMLITLDTPWDGFPQTPTARLNDLMERLQAGFGPSRINIGDVELNVEVVIGSTSSADLGESHGPITLLNFAETALMEAKELSQANLAYGETQDVEKHYEENIFWSKKIKQALLTPDENLYIVPVYHGIYNYMSCRVEKFECLCRLHDGEKLVSPFYFMEPMKKLGLVPLLTRIVAEAAFKRFKGTDFEFSINIGRQDLEDPGFVSLLERYSSIYRVRPSKVVLELLEEDGILEHLDTIARLREKGFKIAIDDFGTGYSNFETHQKLKADYLKIDGSLIKVLDQSEDHVALVQAIHDYAKSIRAKTIAEFVSSEKIFKIVERIGVDYAQGHYVHKPSENPNDAFSSKAKVNGA